MNTPNPNPTPFDLFTFYLAPAMLDKPRTVTVKSASVEMIFNTRTNADAPAIVLAFVEARRCLKLNKTQAQAMMDITGKEKITEWAGTRITLSPAMTKSHKQTILIEPAK